MVVPQATLIELAATRRVRVLGSLEDVAVCVLAVDVGVGLGLAVGVDGKRAEARRGGEESRKTSGGKSAGWGIHLLVAVAALVRTCPWRVHAHWATAFFFGSLIDRGYSREARYKNDHAVQFFLIPAFVMAAW